MFDLESDQAVDSVQSLRHTVSQVRELRQEVDKLRELLSNQYAEDMGKDLTCVTH